MNWKRYTVLPILSAILLTACGVNNNEANETAYRNGIGNRDMNELQRVRYFPGEDAGAAGSNTNFYYNNRYHDTGMIDRDHLQEKRRNLGYRNITNNRGRANDDGNENRIAVADRAADKITALKEVRQANVFVTENNAYVAAQLETNISERKRHEIEKRISDIVKSTDRDIDQVYVSVNPDFYQRTASFADDIRNGRPISGFAEEFTTLIQRIFPTATR